MEIHDRQRERDPRSNASDRRGRVAAAVQRICRRIASTNRGVTTSDHPELDALAGDRLSAAGGGGNCGILEEAPDAVEGGGKPPHSEDTIAWAVRSSRSLRTSLAQRRRRLTPVGIATASALPARRR